MKMKQILTLSMALITVTVFAKENVPNPNMNNTTYSKVAAGCSPATSQTDLDVNNILNAGFFFLIKIYVIFFFLYQCKLLQQIFYNFTVWKLK